MIKLSHIADQRNVILYLNLLIILNKYPFLNEQTIDETWKYTCIWVTQVNNQNVKFLLTIFREG